MNAREPTIVIPILFVTIHMEPITAHATEVNYSVWTLGIYHGLVDVRPTELSLFASPSQLKTTVFHLQVMKVLEQAPTAVLMSMNVLQILITARMKLIVQTPEGALLAIVKLDSVEMVTNVQASQF